MRNFREFLKRHQAHYPRSHFQKNFQNLLSDKQTNMIDITKRSYKAAKLFKSYSLPLEESVPELELHELLDLTLLTGLGVLSLPITTEG